MDIKIIYDKDNLKDTIYFEILPGEYKNKCWNSESIYLDEETFGFIEKIVENIVSEYDHYSFIGINKKKWYLIVNEIKNLIRLLNNKISCNELENYVYFFFKSTKKKFEEDYENNVLTLIALLNDFNNWIEKQLKDYDKISILGI